MRLTLPRNRSLLRCAAAGRLRKLDAAAEESEKSVVDALRHQLDGDSVERCYGRSHGLDDTVGEQRRRTCREWKHVLSRLGRKRMHAKNGNRVLTTDPDRKGDDPDERG